MSASASMESVGIIGAGNAGQAIPRTVMRAGRQVVLANSRDPETLASVVAQLDPGASAGTVADAAGSRWSRWPSVGQHPGGGRRAVVGR